MLLTQSKGDTTLVVLFIMALLIGCKEKTYLPENNNFSYLEPEAAVQPISFKEESAMATGSLPSKKSYRCHEPNISLLGMMQKIEYYGPPGFGKTPAQDLLIEGVVLNAGSSIQIECTNRVKISTKEILLEIPKDIPYEHLIGGNILAIGQLEMNGNPSGSLPVKMRVLRVQSILQALH